MGSSRVRKVRRYRKKAAGSFHTHTHTHLPMSVNWDLPAGTQVSAETERKDSGQP